MDAIVKWHDGLSFTATAGSGYSAPLGAETAVGGSEDGFRPLELIAAGLAGCTAMDVISILQKKRQAVTAFEVHVHARRAEQHPRVFTRADIEYYIIGSQVDQTAVLRAIELSATRYCPAQAMLGQVFPITLKYRIYEQEAGGERRLVSSGEFAQPVAAP
jgi:putative redox protein